MKRVVILSYPYLIIFYLADKCFWLYRHCIGDSMIEKIGVMLGNPETTTGGNALKFYASVRLDIRRVTSIKDGDEVVGNQVRVKVVKNKVAPPFR